MKVLVIAVLVVTLYGDPVSSGYQSTTSRQHPISSYLAPLASVGALPRNSSFPNNSEVGSSTISTTESEQTSAPVSLSTEKDSSSDSPVSVYSDNADDYYFGSNQNIIEKNIYIHLPPSALEQQQAPAIHLPPPRTHYKIIFIKSPSPPTAPPVISPLVQSEEKTIVYVLVRKPENEEIVIPTPKPTQPSKPEVYFIRYSAQTEKSNASTEEKNSEGSINHISKSNTSLSEASEGYEGNSTEESY